MRNHEEHRDFNEGYIQDLEKLLGDQRKIQGDFERAMDRLLADLIGDGHEVTRDREGNIHVKVSPTRRVTDEDSSARSASNITPKKQRGSLSKLASIWSILSSKLKSQREKK